MALVAASIFIYFCKDILDINELNEVSGGFQDLLVF